MNVETISSSFNVAVVVSVVISVNVIYYLMQTCALEIPLLDDKTVTSNIIEYICNYVKNFLYFLYV